LKGIVTRLKDITRAGNYDIVFVQREAFMTGSAFFEKKFSRSGAKLIFDFDDSIWLSNVSDANKNLEWLKDYSKTGRIIEYAHLVIAGNKYLSEYALNFNKNVITIPTTIDTSYHTKTEIKKNNDVVCIGWTGTSTTLRHLQIILPVLEKLKKKYKEKIEFRIISEAPFNSNGLDVKWIKWNKQEEINQLSHFDIGIMPLPDNDWARGKCGFKGLQYMSLEIPPVMSPVGVNNEIIEDGKNGFLASGFNEWENKLSLLIDSADLRKQLGREARKTIEENYSVESQKNIYLSEFKKLLEL
jgi:glycosyltransferase involved in cell wall biosynthesis